MEEGKVYEEPDFNRIIEIKAREEKRVRVILDEIDQNEKTIIFCATQDHAAAVRDLVNQMKENPDPSYCVRVTANDGARGEQALREFQDNEKTIPTILTTSQKLSTGVDARNVRNIVLMRPVNSMVEFKQIIGRGTRLFDGKEYFTIYDFVDAYHHFSDPEWDGEPIEETCPKCDQNPCVCETQPPKKCSICGEQPCLCEKPPKVCPVCEQSPCECNNPPKKKLKIKLSDGKVRDIQHMISTSFWGADGKPLSSEEFITKIYGVLPDFFQSEEELRKIWSNPITRKEFLGRLFDLGIDLEQLDNIQKVVNAENCDLFDVLSYLAYNKPLITRQQRIDNTRENIFKDLDDKNKEFLDFVLSKYEQRGVEELGEEKLPVLLNLKYNSSTNAINLLGDVGLIRSTFFNFQERLYAKV